MTYNTNLVRVEVPITDHYFPLDTNSITWCIQLGKNYLKKKNHFAMSLKCMKVTHFT